MPVVEFFRPPNILNRSVTLSVFCPHVSGPLQDSGGGEEQPPHYNTGGMYM